MLNKLAERSRSEKGFTLIELLVVILIIGILAAIALPAFLGQRAKGQDSAAKSDARNMVSELESCFATTQDYSASSCSTAVADAGLAAADVAVSGASATGYVITAASASGNNFIITKTATGSARTCNITGNTKKTPGTSKGGCNGTSW